MIEDRPDSEWSVLSSTIDERVEDQRLGIGVAPSLAITELARGESDVVPSSTLGKGDRDKGSKVEASVPVAHEEGSWPGGSSVDARSVSQSSWQEASLNPSSCLIDPWHAQDSDEAHSLIRSAVEPRERNLAKNEVLVEWSILTSDSSTSEGVNASSPLARDDFAKA